MRRIVVTGGAGFVGSHLVHHFWQNYPTASIVVLDKFSYPARHHYLAQSWTGGRIEILTGDICDASVCREAFQGADLVIHAAAESHVDNSFDDPSGFTRTNVTGTGTVLAVALQTGVRRMIHVSTDEVYGERPHNDVDETGALTPTNPYSASKAAADMLVIAYHKANSLPVTIVRANNMYGAHQFPEKIIPRFICRLLRGETLPIHGDGRNMRSYLSTHDFAAAVDLLVERGTHGEIYNIGSCNEYSNIEIASLLCRHFGRDPNEACMFIKDRPFNDSRYGIIDTKIKELGWRQTRHLEDDLPQMIEWYRANLPQYEHFLNTGERVASRSISASMLNGWSVPGAPVVTMPSRQSVELQRSAAG